MAIDKDTLTDVDLEEYAEVIRASERIRIRKRERERKARRKQHKKKTMLRKTGAVLIAMVLLAVCKSCAILEDGMTDVTFLIVLLPIVISLWIKED